MSELQAYYDNYRAGYWASPDAEECACHGRGYALSEVDTWHECRYHHVPGQHHPDDECECGEEVCVDYVAPGQPLAPVEMSDMAPAAMADESAAFGGPFDDDEIPF